MERRLAQKKEVGNTREGKDRERVNRIKSRKGRGNYFGKRINTREKFVVLR